MQRITFEPGKKVIMSGKKYSVIGISNNEVVQLLSADGIEKKVNLETIHDWYRTGNLKAAREEKLSKKDREEEKIRTVIRNENHSEEAKSKGQVIKTFLKAIEENQVKIKTEDSAFQSVVKEVAERFGVCVPSARTIYRWKNCKYLDCIGDERFIPRWNSRGGGRKSRMEKEVQEMMQEVTINEYMTSSKRTIKECHLILLRKIVSANSFRPKDSLLKGPTRNTFEKWIRDNYEGYELESTRNSKAAADNKYRHSGRNSESWEFMQCVEVDHTPLDVMLVDEAQGLVMGRARLTLMIEWKTRCCVGFTIGYEGTSTQTVLDCVQVAVSQKGYVKELYPNIENEWPCWGMPSFIKMDNAPEFHSKTFLRSMEEMGISLIFCPRGKAWFKGRVERAIGRLNKQLMNILPGATLTQLYNRTTGNDPSKYAVIDIERLREIVHIWVIDDYHQTYVKDIKSTPGEAWIKNFALEKVALPGDQDLVEILCTELDERTLQHYGIEMIEQRSFNNNLLYELRKRKQFDKTIKVKVRYKMSKLDRIWVYDEDRATWIMVENSNPETRELNCFQIQLINQMRREEEIKTNTLPSIAETKEKIQNLVTDMMKSKKQTERKRAYKIMGFSNQPISIERNGLSPKKEVKKTRRIDENKLTEYKYSEKTPIREHVELKENKVNPEKKEKTDKVYEGEMEIYTCEVVSLRGVRRGW